MFPYIAIEKMQGLAQGGKKNNYHGIPVVVLLIILISFRTAFSL